MPRSSLLPAAVLEDLALNDDPPIQLVEGQLIGGQAPARLAELDLDPDGPPLVAAAQFPHGPASGHGLAYIMGKRILQKGEDVE